MANNLHSFARLYTSIPNHKRPDGVQASGEEILHFYQLTEHESMSELFFAPTLLPTLAKLSTDQLDYERGIIAIKKIGIMLEDLYKLKYH